jgi:hypothetical protein
MGYLYGCLAWSVSGLSPESETVWVVLGLLLVACGRW